MMQRPAGADCVEGQTMADESPEARWREAILALEKERDLLRQRIQELEEALQGCLSRSRH